MSTWSHTDPYLLERSNDALDRAKRVEWSSDSLQLRSAELRALMVRSISAAHELGSIHPHKSENGIAWVVPSFDGATWATTDHNAMATAIVDAWDALAGNRSGPDVVNTRSGTNGDDAGAFPIIGVAVIVAITVGVAWIAQKVAEVVDNDLARSAQSAQLVAHIGAVTTLAEEHTTAELQAGHSLPMNDVQRAAIASLSQSSAIVAARTTPPISEPWAWPIKLFVAAAVLGGGFVLYQKVQSHHA